MIVWKVLPVLICFAACSADAPVTDSSPAPAPAPTPVATETPPPTPAPTLDTSRHHYFSWKENYSSEAMLLHRIPPPAGYQRTTESPDSYADWLRHLPLQPPNTPVLLHNGERKGRQDVHEAVVDIDVGRADLQQCADAVMRLRAEFLYSKQAYANIHFNYTSGDKVSFDDWRQGRKPKVSGNRVTFSQKTGNTDNSYRNFKKYLIEIFKYAGTASLSKELKKVAIADMKIGDVFIQGGFPGHAVVVVDMAVNAEGKKCFLLAQSYMPAQNIHILRNPADDALTPWYSTSFGTTLYTPEWAFDKDQLRRH